MSIELTHAAITLRSLNSQWHHRSTRQSIVSRFSWRISLQIRVNIQPTNYIVSLDSEDDFRLCTVCWNVNHHQEQFLPYVNQPGRSPLMKVCEYWVRTILSVRGGLPQWWEHSSFTIPARVWFQDSASYGGLGFLVLLSSERFFSGFPVSPLSPKINIWFDLICCDSVWFVASSIRKVTMLG